MVISPRRRVPTPFWAERRVLECDPYATCGPVVTRSFLRRIIVPVGATPSIALPDSLPIVREADTNSPQIALF